LLGTRNLPRLYLILAGKTGIGDRQQSIPVFTIIGSYHVKRFRGLFPFAGIPKAFVNGGEANLHHFDWKLEFIPNLGGIPSQATPPGVGFECIFRRIIAMKRMPPIRRCAGFSIIDNRLYKIARSLAHIALSGSVGVLGGRIGGNYGRVGICLLLLVAAVYVELPWLRFNDGGLLHFLWPGRFGGHEEAQSKDQLDHLRRDHF